MFARVCSAGYLPLPGVFLVGVLNVTEVSGAGIEVVPNLPEVSDTDIEVVPNLSKCRVPVSSSYRTIPDCPVGYEALPHHFGKVNNPVIRCNTLTEV